jgi:hypothetical protein
VSTLSDALRDQDAASTAVLRPWTDPGAPCQAEVRLLLEPTAAGPLEPFVLSVPRLRQYCSLYQPGK